jgi:hypothetical protein
MIDSEPEKNPDSFPDLIWRLITTPLGWIGIVGVTSFLSVAMWAAIRIIPPEETKITTSSGTITLKKGSREDTLFLLSPNGGDQSTPWVETGIKIKKDDKIKITASGRVNTAIKRVVAQTLRPEVDEPIWASPSGIKPQKINTTYFPSLDQMKLLLDKNGAYYGFGMLLATVKDSKAQIKTENIVPFVENPEFIEFTAKNDGELMLTVNDIWLSDDMKDDYVIPFNDNSFNHYLQLAEYEAAIQGDDFTSWSDETKRKKAEEQCRRRENSWDSIVNNNKWNIWYADNIGSFSVSITVNEKN